MENVGIFYAQSVYITAIGCILWPFGSLEGFWYIFLILVCCTKKILATLL
jgi:hypothetical protein